MSKPESHLTSRTLGQSERFQETFGHTGIGRAATRLVAGSSSPAYRQLDWYSNELSSVFIGSALVPGNPTAGRLPRNWRTALIMAVESKRLSALKESAINDGLPFQEAVAYISDDIVHVGSKPNQGHLFEKLNEDEVAVAMRIGKGSLQASMGIWLPQSRHFSGINDIRVVEPSIQVSALSQDYPGTQLV